MFDRPLEMSLDGDTLRISGSIDEYALGDLRRGLDQCVQPGRRLIVELSDVDFLPSAGIGLVVWARSAARRGEGDLVVVAAEGSTAQRILATTGVEHDLIPPRDADPSPPSPTSSLPPSG